MDRRDFIKMASFAGLGLTWPGRAAQAAGADPYPGPYYLMIHAGGGWDPTMVCDPKGSETEINRQFTAAEIEQAGEIRYAPVVYGDGETERYSNRTFFEKHHQRLMVINGIDTTTNSHETGTRLTWSGDGREGFPSFAALAASQKSEDNPLAFISGGGYEGTGGLVSITRVGNVDAVTSIAYPNRIDPRDEESRFHTPRTANRLARHRRERLETLYEQASLRPSKDALSRLRVARSGGSLLSRLTEYLPDSQTLNQANNSLHRQSLVAFAAFRAGVSVSANLQVGGFDTHGNHDAAQANALERLLVGVDRILDEAEAQGLRDKVVVCVGSEFGRTPRYNGGNGKDHWNITSMLLAGPGIPGNKVVGATDDGQRALKVDTSTLEAGDRGVKIHPKHVNQALRKLSGVAGSSGARSYPLALADLPLFQA